MKREIKELLRRHAMQHAAQVIRQAADSNDAPIELGSTDPSRPSDLEVEYFWRGCLLQIAERLARTAPKEAT